MRIKLGLCLVAMFAATFVACGGGASTGGGGGGGGNVTLSSIAVKPGAPGINVGDTQQFSASGTYSDNSVKDITSSVTWSTSDSGVATVSGSGLATGVHGGQATITATSGSVKGNTTLTVTAVLSSISVKPVAPDINVGDTQQFKAAGTYNDGSVKDITSSVTWSSSDSATATISTGGLATGVHSGQATITATSGSLNGNATLTVTAVLVSITLSPTNPGVFVGNALQFTATGHYNDGSQNDITGSVTWSSSDPTKATINNSGLAKGVHGGNTTISATSGIIQGTTNLTVTALLNAVAVTPIGPAVQVNKNLQFTATGTYNDGTIANITASSAWTSSNPAAATIGANTGLAKGVSKGVTLITASATSADGTQVNGSTALHVVTTAAPNLNGPYAFTLVGADARGNQYYMGSFFADGNGNLSSGAEDANTAAGLNTNVPLTGSYQVFADGRGVINFNANAIHPNGITLRFVLSGSGASAKLMEFDGAGSLKGEFKPQTPGAALQAGKYVYLSSGADASTGKMQQVGIFKTNGSGNIGGGKFDANDAGTIIVGDLAASSYTAPDANGRGTLMLSVVAPAITQNYVYYVVDDSRINLIQVDAAPNSALGGFAELQTGVSSKNSDFSGAFSFLLEHPMLAGDPNLRGEFGILGHLQSDGAGTITDGVQDEHHDFRVNYPTVTGSYAITGANARGVLTELLTPPLTETYIFYMISTTKMVMLHTQNGNIPVSTPDAGVGEQQSPTFGVTTLNGDYALSGSELAGSNTEVLGVLTFDGTNSLYGIEDVSQNGALFSKILNDTYELAPDANSGRGDIGPGPTPDPLTDYLIYVISGNKAWSVGADQPDLKPDTMGSLEIQ